MGWNQKIFLNEDFLDPWRTIAVRSPALITPLPDNISPNRLASSVPNSILRNPGFCSFASVLIISVTPSDNNLREI